jgi:leucine dehydrogenase
VPAFEALLEVWDGETVVVRRDGESGCWLFICLPRRASGPAGGGTRMKVYGTPAEALEDAMRLSAAMTRKLAVAGLPFGGGKGVIAVSELPRAEPAARSSSATAISSNRSAAPIGRART